jgi:hypothetical protein
MLTSHLVSLPPETLRQMDAADQRPKGGGSSGERRIGIAVLFVAVILAPIAALLAR